MHVPLVPPRFLAVAHGTASAAGRSTLEALIAAIAASRPDTHVDLCFLDVLDPRLPAALDDSPTVAVPLLLSTGYHVQHDIPAALADVPATVVARHLGPHDLLVDALADRLAALPDSASTALVGAGSTRSGAAAELDRTGELLALRSGRPVRVLTMADDLTAELAALPRPVSVATYLLAEGRFVDETQAAAAAVGGLATPALGAHPAVVELAWRRYDEAAPRVG